MRSSIGTPVIPYYHASSVLPCIALITAYHRIVLPRLCLTAMPCLECVLFWVECALHSASIISSTFLFRLGVFLLPSGRVLQLLSTTGESVWIYAWGRSNTFVEHVVDGRVGLALDSCVVQNPSIDSSAKQYAHAW